MYSLATLLVFLAYVTLTVGAISLTLYVIVPHAASSRRHRARYRRHPAE